MTVNDGDIVRAVGSLSLGRGTIMQQVFHFRYTGTGDTDDAVGDAIKLWFTSVYTNVETDMDNLCVSTEVGVWLYDMVAHVFNGIYQEDWLFIIGTLAGYEMPNGVAALVKLHTGLPRRQGRKFVSGLGIANYLDTGWAAPMIVNLALMIADIFAVATTPNGVLNSGTFNVDDTSTLYETFEMFKNSGVINFYADYQRRRRPGVGI